MVQLADQPRTADQHPSYLYHAHPTNPGPPPEIMPPEPRARRIVWASLLFLGVILVFATVNSALASSGVLAVVIVATAIAGTLVLWRGPSARRPRPYTADPEQISALGGRFQYHDLRR